MQNNFAKRDISIDLVKLIAIIGVVIIHSCDFSLPVASIDWNLSLFWRTLSGASVPLFLMASGAVMLDCNKKITLKKLYLKNILRILVSMFFWGVLYKIFHLSQSNGLTLSTAINGVKEVLFFNQEFHFYYMHMILVVYAFLPITRLIVAHADQKTLRYLILLWFLFAIIYPTLKQFYPVNLFGGMTTMWSINLTYASIGYGILGYYLKKYPLSITKSIICFLSGVISMYTLTLFKSVCQGVLYEHFLSGNTFCAAFLAAGIFGFSRCIDISSINLKSFISWISKASFCVYLVHMFVMYFFKDNGFTVSFGSYIISIPVYAFLIIAVCLVIYYILSKIPLVRKWLV